MLETINRYAHGLTAIPVIIACKRRGLFVLLERKPASLSSLAKRLKAKEGYLNVALNMLESLRLVEQRSDSTYTYLPRTAVHHEIPEAITELLSMDMEAFLSAKKGKAEEERLCYWLDHARSNWDVSWTTVADFLDGVLWVPLLLALRGNKRFQKNQDKGDALFSGFPQAIDERLSTLFIDKEWANTEKGHLRLTEIGAMMLDRIMTVGTVASYRPMFARIEEVIFGDATRVFQRDATGAEKHVDRRLNVIGSGFQHGKYFTDLEAVILSIFNKRPFEDQPKYIADMGCGNGAMLKRVYTIIRDQSERGKALDAYPLKLIGIDYNVAALRETQKTLKALPHLCIKGDIGDPQQLLEDLSKNGIDPLEEVLHIRSFLDHDRPFILPADEKTTQWRSQLPYHGTYVDRNGDMITPATAVQSQVEHLKRWADTVGKYGLILLEVHRLRPRIAYSFLDKSESLHFDTYHGFSHQYLMEADVFIMCAAESGLFPKAEYSKRYPKALPFTRITLNHFEKHDYRIRHPYSEDIPALMELEKSCRHFAHRSSETAIRERVETFAQGQLIVEEEDGRITAALYSQKVEDETLSLEVIPRQGPNRFEKHRPVLKWLYTNALQGENYSNRGEALCAFAATWMEFKGGYEATESPALCPIYTSDYLQDDEKGVISSVISHLRKVIRTSTMKESTEELLRPERELEAFGARWLLHIFQEMGVFEKAGETYDENTLKTTLQILPKYHRLYRALLGILERFQLVKRNDGRVKTLEAIDHFCLKHLQKEVIIFKEYFQKRYPDHQPLLNLVSLCLEHYASVMTGKIAVNEVIFPKGSMNTFKGIFKGNKVADYFNDLVAQSVYQSVSNFLRNSKQGHPKLKIIEIGAGTGGTTEVVLEKLAPLGHKVAFYYTDISSSFTRYGEKQFGNKYSWVFYKTLDIEKAVESQGLEPRSFNVVLASNALHDTRVLHNTLQEARTLLKPGGVLILNEFTRIKDFLLYTGGLLQGAWSYKDKRYRLKGFCLSSVELWQKVLEECGFEHFTAFGLPDEKDLGASEQSVMVCERPYERTTRQKVRSGEPKHMMEVNVAQECKALLQVIMENGRMNAFTPTRPIMEMGLDSLELLELRALIGERFHLELEPTFFFKHKTFEATVDFLKAHAPLIDLNADTDDASSLPVRNSNAIRAEKKIDEETTSKTSEHAIAIVGMACRFPCGNETKEGFWQVLAEGRDAISLRPAGRWQWPDNTTKGEPPCGFLENIDAFDAAFFRLSPREAAFIDPQQRMLMEVSWEAFEDAGCPPEKLFGSSTGVYVGVCHYDYRGLLESNLAKEAAPQIATGTAPSIFANRLSYFYNFTGPSITVDTACSSSLVAVHQAVEALEKGACEQALVGGVNLICSPTNTLLYQEAGMLAEDSRCKTFDASANGYVRGEGVTAVLLKPLSKAIEHNDHIYGLVKGSAINHGGQASSLTAPNPQAQSALLFEAYQKASVLPGSIGYIEAHGTGTALGDPIEIDGLKDAFARLYETTGDKQPIQPYCGIGSVKTNIGHLEGASGLAGMIKVLLCMQYGQLPASLHFQTLNPAINLANSPFFIVEKTQTWERLRDDQGNEFPRRAGVSSFGFGGANAHVVLEEYNNKDSAFNRQNDTAKSCYLITLSAKSENALKRKVEALSVWLVEKGSEQNLAAVSYTLNAGRSHFERRCVLIVNSMPELKEKLNSLQKGQTPGSCFIGDGSASKPEEEIIYGQALKGLLREFETIDYTQATHYQKQLSALAELYVRGYDLDWQIIHRNEDCQRISLPTYPFEQKRYWVDTQEPVTQRHKEKGSNQLHSLVHENVSNLDEVCFKTKLTGDEFYLADHIVCGEKVLPGVAYIEMLRAAGGYAQPEKRVRAIKHITWMNPIKARQNHVAVSIHLLRKKDRVTFTVATQRGSVEPLLHSQGEVDYANKADCEQPASLSIEAIRQRCPNSKTKAFFYKAFQHRGVDCGHSFQVIETVWNNQEEALAILQMPHKIKAETRALYLPPNLMDGALQTLFAILSDKEDAAHQEHERLLYLPFSIDEIVFFHALPQRCYAYAKTLTFDKKSNAINYQVWITDEAGKVLVQLKGIQLRSVSSEWISELQSDKPAIIPDSDPPFYFYPHWVSQALQKQKEILLNKVLFFGAKPLSSSKVNEGNKVIHVRPDSRYAEIDLLCYHINFKTKAHYGRLFKTLKERDDLPENIVYYSDLLSFHADSKKLSLLLHETFCALLYLAQALAQVSTHSLVRLFFIIPSRTDEVSPFYEAVVSFAKTLTLEHPNLKCRVMGWEQSYERDEKNRQAQLWEKLSEEIQADNSASIAVHYDSKMQRLVRQYQEVSSKRQEPVLKNNGVYLITGGTGGLGLLFARYLCQQYQAKVVLVGRSALTQKKQQQLTSLTTSGGEVFYIQGDVSKQADIKRVLKRIHQKYKTLNGVLHSAGIIHDSLIIKKDKGAATDVLSPKINGAMLLDEATRSQELDCFVVFSSLTATVGNIGQCDYAYANGFMDGYIAYRNRLMEAGECSGKSFSINWPLWSDGGMQINEVSRERLKHTWGITPLDTASGLQAFVSLLQSDHPNIIPLKGQKDLLEKTLGITKAEGTKDRNIKERNASLDSIETLEKELIALCSEVLKINVSELDSEIPFEKYGLDSIMMIRFVNQFEAAYGHTLSVGVFNEQNTIHRLARYLVDAEVITFNNLTDVTKHSQESDTVASQTQILMQQDAQLSLDLSALKTAKAWKKAKTTKNILLTGATGFLGAFLLKELLEQTKADVFCLMRKTYPENTQAFEDNLKQYGIWNDAYRKRIRPVHGDLTLPRLGIDENRYSQLCQQVDHIYHNGAQVHHLLSYTSLREPNVLSTKEIIQMASAERIKPIHFISSAALCFRQSPQGLKTLPLEKASRSAKGITFGYIQSKWVGEQLILKAQEQGIPTTIFRVGQITSSGDQAMANNQDIFHSFLQLFFEMNGLPLVEYLYLNPAPVDYASKAIVHITQHRVTTDPIYGIVHPTPLPIGQFLKQVNSCGHHLKGLPYEAWIQQANDFLKQYDEKNPRSLLKELLKNTARGRLFDLYFKKYSLKQTNTVKMLEGSNIVCPPFTKDFWKPYLKDYRRLK